MEQPIAVFDFDKTLTYKDSVLGFFLFCNKAGPSLFLKYYIYLLFLICGKIKIISNKSVKNVGIFLFLSKHERYYLESKGSQYIKFITTNKVYSCCFQNSVFQKLHNIIIVSASLSIYLKYLFPSFRVLASEMSYENEKPKGLKFHCYKDGKAQALNSLGISNIDVLYTDSLSDLSLVSMSSTTFLVSGDSVFRCNSKREFFHLIKRIRENRSRIERCREIFSYIIPPISKFHEI